MDLKALGYFISTVSVFLLGIVAWPKPDEPQWKAMMVGLGMAASIVGMGVRWISHRQQKRKVEQAKREADGAAGQGDDGPTGRAEQQPQRPMVGLAQGNQ